MEAIRGKSQPRQAPVLPPAHAKKNTEPATPRTKPDPGNPGKQCLCPTSHNGKPWRHFWHRATRAATRAATSAPTDASKIALSRPTPQTKPYPGNPGKQCFCPTSRYGKPWRHFWHRANQCSHPCSHQCSHECSHRCKRNRSEPAHTADKNPTRATQATQATSTNARSAIITSSNGDLDAQTTSAATSAPTSASEIALSQPTTHKKPYSAGAPEAAIASHGGVLGTTSTSAATSAPTSARQSHKSAPRTAKRSTRGTQGRSDPFLLASPPFVDITIRPFFLGGKLLYVSTESPNGRRLC